MELLSILSIFGRACQVGGSYVLQRVLCGKPTCRCARAGGELHGPYWYHYWKMDRKTKNKYVGKNRPAEGA